jgi:hypothetical protein
MTLSSPDNIMSHLNPGSMLVDSNNNDDYGVMVDKISPTKVIVFRLDKKTYPVFSKLTLNPHIIKHGNINEFKNTKLKSALLKYYHTTNMSKNEKNKLNKLIDFAFPLGVPAYQPEKPLTDDEQAHLNLHRDLDIGRKVFINTPKKSLFNFLDNTSVVVISKNQNGIWVVHPQQDDDTFHYLPYQDSSIPKFCGISRMNILNDPMEHLENYLERFKKLNQDNNLVSVMNHDGQKVKVSPLNFKVIFPHKLQNLHFIPSKAKFEVHPDFVKDEPLTNENYVEPEYQYQERPILDYSIQEGGASSKEELVRDLRERDDIEAISQLNQQFDELGKEDLDLDAVSKNEDNEDILSIMENDRRKELKENSEIQEDVTETEELASNKKETTDTSSIDEESLSSSDMSDTDLEDLDIVEEDEVEEVGVYQKVKRVEIDELEKVYKESIQKGDLHKYKLEKIPKLRRNDINVINRLNKEINTISLLKHLSTQVDEGQNNIKILPPEFKPLINNYSKADFTNQLLIPVVLNKKKIYLEGESLLSRDEYNTNSTIPKDYYQDLENFNNQYQSNKQVSNHDSQMNLMMNELNPNQVVDNSELGLLFRLGEGISEQDSKKVSQDTITIRHCNNTHKCQSFPLVTKEFDYQMSLGSVARYVNEEEYETFKQQNTENVDLEDETTDLLEIRGKQKVMFQGDILNVVGFLRPPINYLSRKNKLGLVKDDSLENDLENNRISADGDNTNLENLYQDRSERNLIKILQLNEVDNEFNIFEDPDNFVYIMLPNSVIDKKILTNEFNSILPNIEQILKVYRQFTTVSEVYDILKHFNYSKITLTHNDALTIHKLTKKYITKMEKFDKLMTDKYQKYIKQRDADIDKRDKDMEEYLSSDKETDISGVNFITDTIFKDIEKLYYNDYQYYLTDLDNDVLRLNWLYKRDDNGLYLFKYLLLDHFKTLLDNQDMEKLQQTLTMLKEKHQSVELRKPADKVTESLAKQITKCQDRKLNQPKIIKYPNVERMMEDNQKVIIDSDGETVSPGDYALIKGDSMIELYKRTQLVDGDIWVKEDIETLHRLIFESKQRCEEEKETMDLDEDVCLFNEEKFVCQPIDIMKIDDELSQIQETINEIQQQMSFLQELPTIVKDTEGSLKEMRDDLVFKNQNTKKYWKHKEDIANQLDEEISKTIFRKNECIHYKVVDYFNSIPTTNLAIEEKYHLAMSIFNKFLDTDREYDLNTYDAKDDENNWTCCSLCKQHLLSKHYLAGVEYLKKGEDIDFLKLATTFGFMKDNTYICKIDGEPLYSIIEDDVEEFAGGEDNNKRIKTREVIDDPTYYETQLGVINQKVDGLLEQDDIVKRQDMQFKLGVYKIAKTLLNLPNLTVNDEIEMLNYLQSESFVSKKDLLNVIIKKIPEQARKPAVISQLVNKTYNLYVVCDIMVRLLITLQTSTYVYSISNKFTNSNFIGYPLINDKSEKDGIDMILSLMNQMSTLEKYEFLNDTKIESKLMDRLTKQLDGDEFVKNKLMDALYQKSESINDIEAFRLETVNYWNEFKPMLNIGVNWTPDKIISKSSLEDLNLSNYQKMTNVCLENYIYQSNILTKRLYNQIKDQKSVVIATLNAIHNACCITDNTGNKQHYLDYFIQNNKDIEGNLKKLNELEEVYNILNNKKRLSVFHIYFAPKLDIAYQKVDLSINMDNVDEINSVFLKYIGDGQSIGENHLFDKFGRCVISNKKKSDIMENTYTRDDFIKLVSYIYKKNMNTAVINTDNFVLELKDDFTDKNKLLNVKEEIEMIHNVLDIIPKEKGYHFIYNLLVILKNQGYLNEKDELLKDDLIDKFLESPELLFDDNKLEKEKEKFVENNEVITDDNFDENKVISKKDLESKSILNKNGKNKFNLNKLIIMLNSQTEVNIEHVANTLSGKDEDINKIEKNLSNLGEYTKLLKEFTDKNKENIDGQNRYHYRKKEDSLRNNIKYLKDVMNQIKNNKLNMFNKDDVRPQFRPYFKFKNNNKLFKLLSESIQPIIKIMRVLKSKSEYKNMNNELVSSINHYLLILALIEIMDTIKNSNMKNKKGSVVIVKHEEQKTNIITGDDVDTTMVKDPMERDYQIYEPEEENFDHDSVDFVKDISIQYDSNIGIIKEFILICINNMVKTQEEYDAMTQDNINQKLAEHNQKKIARNLKTFAFLKEEGRDEERNIVMGRMALNKLGYKDLSEYMNNVYGEDFFNPDETEDMMLADQGNVEGEVMEDGGDYDRKNNELGFNNQEMNEIAFVGDADEGMEEQDYGYMVADYD